MSVRRRDDERRATVEDSPIVGIGIIATIVIVAVVIVAAVFIVALLLGGR